MKPTVIIKKNEKFVYHQCRKALLAAGMKEEAFQLYNDIQKNKTADAITIASKYCNIIIK